MKLHSLTPALLALAGVLFTQPAQAFGPGVSASSGDLILAFEATSGTGSTLNYEVDLGSITNFTAGTGTPFSSININTDLTNIYGAGWFNDTSLSFVIVGAVNNGNLSTSAGTIKNGSVLAGDPNAPTLIGSEGSLQLNGAKNSIGVLYGPSASAAAGTTSNSLSILTTDNTSYHAASGGSLSFGSLGPISSTFAASGTTPINLALDLLQTTGTTTGTSAFVGAPGSIFSLGSDGTLSFSVQSVPEPSTYALMLGGLVLLWQVGRRKFAHLV